MVYNLYLFRPGTGIVRSVPLYGQEDIQHVNKWISQYNQSEGVRLIRAVLGPNELAVLAPDEDLRIPGMTFAAPAGGRVKR